MMFPVRIYYGRYIVAFLFPQDYEYGKCFQHHEHSEQSAEKAIARFGFDQQSDDRLISY